MDDYDFPRQMQPPVQVAQSIGQRSGPRRMSSASSSGSKQAAGQKERLRRPWSH